MPADLPGEIYDLIVQILVKETSDATIVRPALKQCALASRRLWFLARKHIFDHVDLFIEKADILSRFLDLISHPEYPVTSLIHSVNLELTFLEGSPMMNSFCRAMELLLSCGVLRKLCVQGRDWYFSESNKTGSASIYALFRMHSLESLEIRNVHGMPPDAFNNTHITTLILHDFNGLYSLRMPIPSPMNGPPLTYLETDNTFPFLDWYHIQLSNLKTLISTRTPTSRLDITRTTVLRCSETLESFHLDIGALNDLSPTFELNKNVRLTHLRVRLYCRRHDTDMAAASDIVIFCDKFLRPSSSFLCLAVLDLHFTLLIRNWRSVSNVMESSTSRRHWGALDGAICHSNCASIREVNLEVLFRKYGQDGIDRPGLSTIKQISRSAEKCFRSFFPALEAAVGKSFAVDVIIL